MGWRTVVITERSQLSYKLGYLTIRNAEKPERIFLDEIDCLIVESCASYLNSGLVDELARRKIAVLFCDRRHNPAVQMLPLSGAFDVRRKITEQLDWDQAVMDEVWRRIVSAKIARQADVLSLFESASQDAERLRLLAETVEPADLTNLEAQAARRYFAVVFGREFNRKDMDWHENAALNYGYAILLGLFNRSVVANGYLTQLGIHHIGNENAFNLSCDLMEPFRPAIDRHLIRESLWDLNPTNKLQIVNAINTQVVIEGQKHYLANAVSIYCKNALDALSLREPDRFVDFEFCE
ncbi:MAG: type II CRISPR-associated endonuclease Cas1 [Actinomycetes bacterium]|jgi:CRISPR-associated endonuclease Cas1 subtype II|nr:type II CRISPR-associated endonuclease Cas1 [Actinomycetes bacterium]